MVFVAPFPATGCCVPLTCIETLNPIVTRISDVQGEVDIDEYSLRGSERVGANPLQPVPDIIVSVFDGPSCSSLVTLGACRLRRSRECCSCQQIGHHNTRC